MEPASHPTIGCAFKSDDAAIGAARSLAQSGAGLAIRIGARDLARADEVARAAGVASGIAANDPLAGTPGLSTAGDAFAGVNTGAGIGALAGVIAGIALGVSPAGAVLPVEPQARVVSATLLLFVIGMAVGGVLGGAFGARPSTHAGFRLVDAMEDGEIALVAAIDAAQLDAVTALLESAGATDIVVISPPRHG